MQFASVVPGRIVRAGYPASCIGAAMRLLATAALFAGAVLAGLFAASIDGRWLGPTVAALAMGVGLGATGVALMRCPACAARDADDATWAAVSPAAGFTATRVAAGCPQGSRHAPQERGQAR